jgi:hypothetical protein
MKHAILGAGAIGGLVGTALASRGEDVTVVVRPENLTGYPKSLTLERPQGSISAPAKAAAALTEPVDVLWITTKTYQLRWRLCTRCPPAQFRGAQRGTLRHRYLHHGRADCCHSGEIAAHHA